jgi:hypothetical protein
MAVEVTLIENSAAALVNVAQAFLLTRKEPKRLGTAHPQIVPYQAFPAQDGLLMIAVGTDAQFQRLCEVLGRPELAEDPRFSTNPARVQNREVLLPILTEILRKKPRAQWIAELKKAGVPAGPVNSLADLFGDPGLVGRILLEIEHPTVGRYQTLVCPSFLGLAREQPSSPKAWRTHGRGSEPVGHRIVIAPMNPGSSPNSGHLVPIVSKTYLGPERKLGTSGLRTFVVRDFQATSAKFWRDHNFSEIPLILFDVLPDGFMQSFHVLWGEDNPGYEDGLAPLRGPGLGDPRAKKSMKKLIGLVADDGQVGIDPFSRVQIRSDLHFPFRHIPPPEPS